MALPTNSNLLSNKCGETISSNCVVYDGPDIPGLCKGASMTQALFQTSENANCCKGNFPAGHVSAYTGEWIPISMPASGVVPGATWTIPAVGIGGTNVPQYRWTQDGDIYFRGAFQFDIVPSVQGGSVSIPLLTFLPANFPTNWNANQAVRTNISNNPNTVWHSANLFITYPTGALSFNYFYYFLGNPTALSVEIGLGGIRFNIA